MAEISYMEIAKKSFGGVSIKPGALQLRYAVPKNGKPKLYIKLGSQTMKKAKLNIKDRINFVVDPEAGKAFIRPNDGGWKIDPSGKNGAGLLRLPWNSDKLFKFDNKSAVDFKWSWTAKTGIAFDIPVEVEDEAA